MNADISRAIETIKAFESTIRSRETDPYFVRSQMRETLELVDQYLDCAGTWRTRLYALEDAKSFMGSMKEGE